LLQVTLEDLWRGGELRLGRYQGLVDAIQRRADDVYAYCDYDELRATKRTPEEQQLILNLFLDLVRVSLDDEQRDVRWRRTRAELIQGDFRREQALTDLVEARLLRTDREFIQENGNAREIETVDIIHEALLASWPILNATIDAQRELLRQRVRFDLALTEWYDNNRNDAYLLTGVRLAEAESLKLQNDVTMHETSAREFVDLSLKHRDSARQRQLRRTRFVAALFCILAAVALIAAWVAVDRQRLSARSQSQSATSAAVAQSNASTAEAERKRADQQTEQVSRQARLARASELAGEARLSAASNQQRSALLAVAALQQLMPEDPLPATVDQAIYATAGRVSERWFQVGSVPMESMALSVDATTFVTLDQTGFGQVWDLSAVPDTQISSWATPVQHFQLAVSDAPSSFRFRMQLSRDGSWLVTNDEQWRIQLWDLQDSSAQMTPLAILPAGAEARPYALSADGSTLAAVYRNNTIAIWRLTHGQPIGEPQILSYVYDRNDVWLRLSADGNVIVAVDSMGQVTVWDSDRGAPRTFQTEDALNTIVLSEDGSRLILWYKTRDAAVWDLRGDDPTQTAQTLPKSAGTYAPQVFVTFDDGIRIGALTMERSIMVWYVSSAYDLDQASFKTWTEQSDYTRFHFTADGQSLIGSTYDGMIHRWGVDPQGPNNFTEDQLQPTLLGHTDQLLLLAVSESGERFITGDQSGLIRIWNLGAPLLHQPKFILHSTSDLFTFTVDDSNQVVDLIGNNKEGS
jgi:WD40 repeat protein